MKWSTSNFKEQEKSYKKNSNKQRREKKEFVFIEKDNKQEIEFKLSEPKQK